MYNQPSASMDSQPWIKNTVFKEIQLVESIDAEPRDMEG